MAKRISTTPVQYRALLRSVPRSSIDDQRARLAASAGPDAHIQEYTGGELDEWYRYAKTTDVLWVDCLEIIAPLRSKRAGGIPTNKLGEVKGHITAKALTLIEGRTGEQPDAKRWREAAQNVARGRRLSADVARVMGRKGGEKKAVETIQEYWKRHPDHAEFKAIWNGAPGTYADALEVVNEAARKRKYIRLSSVSMAFRVFGNRGVWKR